MLFCRVMEQLVFEQLGFALIDDRGFVQRVSGRSRTVEVQFHDGFSFISGSIGPCAFSMYLI